jgi:hypothetical protein
VSLFPPRLPTGGTLSSDANGNRPQLMSCAASLPRHGDCVGPSRCASERWWRESRLKAHHEYVQLRISAEARAPTPPSGPSAPRMVSVPGGAYGCECRTFGVYRLLPRPLTPDQKIAMGARPAVLRMAPHDGCTVPSLLPRRRAMHLLAAVASEVVEFRGSSPWA